jgi:hypothetical protein
MGVLQGWGSTAQGGWGRGPRVLLRWLLDCVTGIIRIKNLCVQVADLLTCWPLVALS